MAILELQSARLSWVELVEIVASGDILETIQHRAMHRWEKRWMAELVKAYVKIAVVHGDETATTINRRPQIERAFEVGSCNLTTAIWLAAAVGCQVQLNCLNVETEVQEI